jgi:hypothetical protein
MNSSAGDMTAPDGCDYVQHDPLSPGQLVCLVDAHCDGHPVEAERRIAPPFATAQSWFWFERHPEIGEWLEQFSRFVTAQVSELPDEFLNQMHDWIQDLMDQNP